MESRQSTFTEMTVEMVRDAEERGGRDRFSLSLQSWEFMLELGRASGWQPQGTTYVPASTSKTVADVRHGYRPGGVRDYKSISTEDAMNWARALESAKSSQYFEEQISSRFGSSDCTSLRSLMDEFIEYVYGGTFAFAATAGH